MRGFGKYKLLLKRGALSLAVLSLFIFSSALADTPDSSNPLSSLTSSSGTNSAALNQINQICSQNMIDSDTSQLKIFSVGVGCFENITANLAQKTIVGLSAKLANIVFTVMVLYVIFIGLKIATGVTGRIPAQREAMTGLIKLAVVAYLIYGFSDGFNFGIGSSTISALIGIDLGSQPGLVQLYLMVIGSYHSLLTIVMPQNGFGDCTSGSSGGITGGISIAGMNFGNNGTSAVWQSMDCMFSKFIGWNEKNGYGTSNGFSDKGGIALLFGYISSKILPANGFIIGGLLFSTLMTLMLGFFRLAFVYILSMIALILLFAIGPLIVPLMLFERTKGFFEGWMRLIIGCVIQPVILFAFFSFIGGLLSTTIQQLEQLYSTMKPSLETSGVTRTGDTQHMDTVFVMLSDAVGKMDETMVINAVVVLVISYLLVTFIKFVGQMASELSGIQGFDLQNFAPKFAGGGG